MLAANVCAAAFMNKHYKFGVYRVHEEPDDSKLDSLKMFFSLKGFSDSFKKFNDDFRYKIIFIANISN